VAYVNYVSEHIRNKESKKSTASNNEFYLHLENVTSRKASIVSVLTLLLMEYFAVNSGDISLYQHPPGSGK
jgi:hypothetical protein